MFYKAKHKVLRSQYESLQDDYKELVKKTIALRQERDDLAASLSVYQAAEAAAQAKKTTTKKVATKSPARKPEPTTLPKGRKGTTS